MKQDQIETRDVGPLSVRAELQSVDVKNRTVDVVWSTGAKVKRSSWFDGPFFEELVMDPAAVRMDRLNSGNAPFLANHDGYSVADQPGVIESARLEGGKGIATVRFVREGVDPEADKLFAKIVDKVVRNVSVGYRVHTVQKIESADSKIPTMRVTDWEPYEVSAVSMPADAGAGFRSEHAEPLNPCQFITRGDPPITTKHERKNMTPEELKKQQEEQARAEAARVAELEAAKVEATRVERERTVAIRSAVKSAKLDDSFAEQMITEGKSADQARALVLDELATRTEATTEKRGGSGIEVGKTDDEKFREQARAWLLERTGMLDMIADAQKRGAKGLQGISLDGGECRGMSLLDLARLSLERRGVKTRGMDRMVLVGEAFTHRGAYSGASDFSVLLENVMHKVLLGSYTVTPDTWSRFCKKETLADFRTHNRYATGAFSSLDTVPENGEFKNKSIPDGSKKTLGLATKGNIIAISRQLVINDDLGALADVGMKLGRAAKLSIEEDVYALLSANAGLGPTQADAQPFFHSNRANVNGAGSALSVAGIDADRVVMGSQKDPNSVEYLDLRPSVLLVPIGLGGLARQINASQYDHDSSKLQKPNIVQGLFRDVVDTARLSGTRRYLFGDPNVAAAIVVAFLEGQGESPVIETERGWRVDGTELKVRIDYKAQMFDPKGAVTNAGV